MNIMDTLKKPPVMLTLAVFVGIFLGLLYAYVIDPVKYTNLPMTMAREDLRVSYMNMVFDSYRVNGDMELALNRYNELHENGPATLAALKGNPDADQGLIAEFELALAGRTPAEEPQAPADNTLLTVGIIVVALILIGLVAFFIVIPLFRSNRRAPEDMTPAMLAAEHSRTVEKTDYSTSGTEPPVAQYVTTYVLGDDLFDDSFSIDAPSGEFLGECGVGISETVGVGDPKKVAAFEVWMFDKNDIQTVTKVLMSARAFADPAFRSKLEPKGELVQIDPHKQVVLETQTLQMIATISDMQYGQGALPDGSYFDRVTIELAIWSKK